MVVFGLYREYIGIYIIIWTIRRCVVVRVPLFCHYWKFINMCQYGTFLLPVAIMSILEFVLVVGIAYEYVVIGVVIVYAIVRTIWKSVLLFCATCG